MLVYTPLSLNIYLFSHICCCCIVDQAVADLIQVYDRLIPTAGAVAFQIVDQGILRGTKTVVQHVVASEKPLTVKNQRSSAEWAKNAERMRAIPKDQEYRERENYCRNEVCKKKKEARKALLRVPRATCWQEKVANIEATFGIPTTIYLVNTKVDCVEVKTYTHEIISADDCDK